MFVETHIPDILGSSFEVIYLMTIQFLDQTFQLHRIIFQVPQKSLIENLTNLFDALTVQGVHIPTSVQRNHPFTQINGSIRSGC